MIETILQDAGASQKQLLEWITLLVQTLATIALMFVIPYVRNLIASVKESVTTTKALTEQVASLRVDIAEKYLSKADFYASPLGNRRQQNSNVPHERRR